MSERVIDTLNKISEAVEGGTERAKKFHERINERLDSQQERIEEVESRLKSPGATMSIQRESEHKRLFRDWLRKPNDVSRAQALADCQAKAMTIGSDAGGGYAVPTEIAQEIARHELLLSPVRRLVKVVQASTSDFKVLLNLRGATSGWVAEGGTRSATATPLLREIVPSQGELYAYPQVSEWALDDLFFNVDQWLVEEIGQVFAQAEGTAVISGDGSSKPTGFLNATPVSTDDFASPARAAAALEYLPITGSPLGITIDDLVSLVYGLNSEYRQRATFVMNSATTAIVRKLKDSEGRFVWSDSLQAGQPTRLLGYPVETWEQMPAATSNQFPIAFGDWQRGYVLVDRVGIRITRDPFTAPGHVKFYVRKRVGGTVLDNNAIKLLKFASS